MLFPNGDMAGIWFTENSWLLLICLPLFLQVPFSLSSALCFFSLLRGIIVFFFLFIYLFVLVSVLIVWKSIFFFFHIGKNRLISKKFYRRELPLLWMNLMSNMHLYMNTYIHTYIHTYIPTKLSKMFYFLKNEIYIS